MLVVIGGTIPPSDVARLKERGFDQVFGPDVPIEQMVQELTRGAKRKKALRRQDDDGS
jgi:methylmalonyl-CoA mutase cobalamin-binding domain/chain